MFALRNASSDTEIDVPGVRVTATSADGDVLFSEEQYAMALLPGATSYCSVLGDTAGKAPASVDFELLEPGATNMRRTTATCDMDVTSVGASPDGFGGTTFSGSVVVDAKQFRQAFSGYCDTVAATVVLRDESGNPIYAATDYVTPSDGGSTPFSIGVYGAPSYASYDVHVQPW